MNAATTATPPATWALAAVALSATLIGGKAAVGFAMVAVLGVGMLHGISDLALVPAARRLTFLIAYLVVVAAVLGAWLAWPLSALVVFLVASGVHFARDDVPRSRPAERVCHGLLMVAAPALLHQTGLRSIFGELRIPVAAIDPLVATLAASAVAGLALLPLADKERRRDRVSGKATCALALAALILLPPLVGFGFAFLALHAGPELRNRIAATGSDGVIGYVWRHATVALGGAGVLAMTAWMMADRIAVPFALLFAGVAAMAAPHMLVTPLWRRHQCRAAPHHGSSVGRVPVVR